MAAYRAGTALLYLQESTSQLDSISNSADTTLGSLVQNLEIRYSNLEQRYVTCDGQVKFFFSPADISGTIQQLLGFGELLAAVVGADSLSAGTYTVSQYASFPPLFTMHFRNPESASQEINVTLTNVRFTEFTVNVNGDKIFVNNVKFVAETFSSATYKGGP